jgi:hypothetical protein
MSKSLRVSLALLAVSAAWPAEAPAQAQAKPLATVATNWPGISIDVMAVDRKGSVLTVKWAVRNTGAEDRQVTFNLAGQNQNTFVLDEESGTKYYVLTDKEKHGLASQHTWAGGNVYGIHESIPAGATHRHWAKYPAPPAQVKTINLIFPNAEPVEGVVIVDK